MSDDPPPQKNASPPHSIFWWYCECVFWLRVIICVSSARDPAWQINSVCDWICVCLNPQYNTQLKQLSINSSGGRRALYSSWHGCMRTNIKRISTRIKQHACFSLTHGSQGWLSRLAHFLRISQSIHTLISLSMPTSFLNLSPGLFLTFLALSITWEFIWGFLSCCCWSPLLLSCLPHVKKAASYWKN